MTPLTPEQRAEKLFIDNHYRGKLLCTHKDFIRQIAAQIEEAEREIKNKAYEDGLSHGFKDGFLAAKEKAKDELRKEAAMTWSGEAKKKILYLTDLIGKMEPGE